MRKSVAIGILALLPGLAMPGCPAHGPVSTPIRRRGEIAAARSDRDTVPARWSAVYSTPSGDTSTPSGTPGKLSLTKSP